MRKAGTLPGKTVHYPQEKGGHLPEKRGHFPYFSQEKYGKCPCFSEGGVPLFL
jgi:hypothetical protein